MVTFSYSHHVDPAYPLQTLTQCHDRLAKQCAALRWLVPHLAEQGADGEAASAAQGVLRYFDGPSPQHHLDEEEDLFPALLESMAGSDAVCIRELTEGLAQQHKAMEAAWLRLRPALLRIATGELEQLPAAEVERFVTDNLAHREREDSELFPMAARLLGDDELVRIGTAMQARRGGPKRVDAGSSPT